LKKLAVITTHPIQYNAPMFALLAARGNVKVKVFYTWGDSVLNNKYDPGFGKNITWDIPLLEGYEFSFIQNIAADPGSHHFRGIDNPTLVAEIKNWKADAILVYGWNFKSHLKVLRHFKGKKTILFRGDSNLLDENPGFSIRKLFRKILLKWVFLHIDVALYVGKANKAYYLKFGVQERQLKFAPHAVDNARFISGTKNNFRQQLGIPENMVIFLFAGKFEKKKNPGLLINAFMKMNNPEACLFLVGNGELEGDLKQKVNSFNSDVKSRIHFIDFKNQQSMPGIYKSANVFVLPSRGPGETWGLAVNEAMASGLAVLVSDKCGCSRDLVIENENGYTFRSEDIEDLMGKMEKIMLNKDYLSFMGAASQTKISNWTFDKICEAIEDTIK